MTGSIVHPSTPKSDTAQSVVIVGGGLVGLSAALMLARRSIAVTLVELHPFRPVSHENYLDLDSRNTALSRRSVQIYSELGLWPSLQSHAEPILQVSISEIGGFGKATLVAKNERVESFGQVMENRWLGNRLLEMAQSEPLVTLKDGFRVQSVTQSESEAILSIEDVDTAETQILRTPLLVAADGAESFCRKALGIKDERKDFNQTAVVAVVETSKPHEQVAFERFGPQGPLALLPLAGSHRRSVVWIAKKGEEAPLLDPANDGHFLSLLQQAFGSRAGEFKRVGRRGAYPLIQVLAKEQVKGRAVILGNAAHTLHPVAGQGFNLCLRDADTLSRMLEAHLATHEWSSQAKLAKLLRRYEILRSKDQKRVVNFCNSVVHGFTHSNPVLRFGRNLGLVLFEHVPGAKQLVANYAMGLKS